MSNFILKNEPFGSPSISTKYPEKAETGPFAPICSSTLNTVNINTNSNIFAGISLNSILSISNKNITIPVSSDSLWKVWLEVFFQNGTAFAANFNYSNEWWQNYPLTQEYIPDQQKTLLTQVALRIPVLGIYRLADYDDVDGFIFEFDQTLFKIQRHITSDLMLFQSCDGFIFLPSPTTLPISV
jgi:hypothetical protein